MVWKNRRPHEDVVRRTPVVAGAAADEGAQEDGDGRGQHADHQRGAGPVRDAGGHVAAELVGAEEVLAERRQERPADLAEGTAGEGDRRRRRDQDDEGEDRGADQSRAARHQAAPERPHHRA